MWTVILSSLKKKNWDERGLDWREYKCLRGRMANEEAIFPTRALAREYAKHMSKANKYWNYKAIRRSEVNWRG